MTGASLAHIPYPRHAGAGRFRLALAASIFTHLLLAAGTAVEPARPAGGFPGREPVLARLELSTPVPAVVVSEDGKSRLAPRQPVRDRAETRDARRSASTDTPRPRMPDTTRIALPQLPDATVYPATDLDSYPRPLVPLEFGRIPGGAGQLRLELVIDEYGGVSRVTFLESVPPSVPAAALRELLTAARFVPARKDGRAVRSRIQLSVSAGT